MELSGVSVPMSPIQTGLIVQPQTAPPESDPIETDGDEGGGKVKGVIRKLNEGDHFNAVAEVRLRINHFDNPDLVQMAPKLLPDPEDVPGKAYEKFLEQYRALYEASLPPTPPVEPESEPEPSADAIIEPLPETEVPVLDIPQTDPIIVTPLEIEPIFVPALIEPQIAADEGQGILAAFEELWEMQDLEEEPEALDIVM